MRWLLTLFSLVAFPTGSWGLPAVPEEPVLGGPGSVGSAYAPQDHLGSIRVLTDEAGQAVERTTWGPWGTRLEGGELSRFGYTGHAREKSSGLHFSVHRYLDPRNGRWTRRDPLGDVDGQNRLIYVGNNPLKRWDPQGLAGVERLEIHASGVPYRNFPRNPSRESKIPSRAKTERSMLGIFLGLNSENIPYFRINMEYRGFGDSSCGLKTYVTRGDIAGDPVFGAAPESTEYPGYRLEDHGDLADFSNNPLRILDAPGSSSRASGRRLVKKFIAVLEGSNGRIEARWGYEAEFRSWFEDGDAHYIDLKVTPGFPIIETKVIPR